MIETFADYDPTRQPVFLTEPDPDIQRTLEAIGRLEQLSGKRVVAVNWDDKIDWMDEDD